MVVSYKYLTMLFLIFFTLISAMIPSYSYDETNLQLRYSFQDGDQYISTRTSTIKATQNGNEVSGTVSTVNMITLKEFGLDQFIWREECNQCEYKNLPEEFNLENFNILQKGQVYEALIDNRGRLLRELKNPVKKPFKPALVALPKGVIVPRKQWQTGDIIHDMVLNHRQSTGRFTLPFTVDRIVERIRFFWKLEGVTEDENSPVAVFRATATVHHAEYEKNIKIALLYDLVSNMVKKCKMDVNIDINTDKGSLKANIIHQIQYKSLKKQIPKFNDPLLWY
jgi:hypothetical protein